MFIFPPQWQMFILACLAFFVGVLSIIGMASSQTHLQLSMRIMRSYPPLLALIVA